MAETSRIEIITPAEAKKILANLNPNNRPISRRRVMRYAEEMKTGAWKDCIGSVSFGSDKNLLDGQHRLMACIEADVTLRLTVVRGLDPQSMTVIDTGAKRSGSDTLSMAGVTNSMIISAAIRKVLIMESFFGRIVTSEKNSHKANNADILDWYIANPEISDSLAVAGYTVANHRWLVLSTLTAIHWILGGEDRATKFIEDLKSGAGLVNGDPVLALRNFLINRSGARNVENASVLAAYVIAWNHRQTGKTIQQMRVVPGATVFPHPLPPK